MEKAKKVLKIVYGIDMGEEKFEGAQGIFYDDMHKDVFQSKEFTNDRKGHLKYLQYTEKHQKELNPDNTIETWYMVESTGVYHENLVYFLHSHGKNVHVSLPNKVKHFKGTMKEKGKTDKFDARAVTQYGLEKELDKWEPPVEEMRKLKELSRELNSKTDLRTELKNQLHARKTAFKTDSEIIKGLERDIRYMNSRIKQLRKRISILIKTSFKIKSKVESMTTFKGIGEQTVAMLLAETNEFHGIRNRRQIASYSGFDIIENQSGKRTGKTRISKRGNSHIRKGLYMPALACIRCNPKMKALYERVNERHGWKHKKIGIVAVMRKLLLIMYAMWKNETNYDPNYGVL